MIKYPILSFAFILVISLKGSAQEGNIDVKQIIPFELTDHNNIAVEAVINKQDTLFLMFHTAASSVTLTTEAIKKISSIEWNAEGEVNSWGGASNARYSASNEMSIGALSYDSISIWETRNSGPGTDGKFGPNAFEDWVIEIDYESQQIILHKRLPDKTSGFTKSSLRSGDGFMFLSADSKISDSVYTNEFLIHSGYGGTILYDDAFVAKSKIGQYVEITDERELKDSYGNTVKTKKGKLPQFNLAGVRFEGLPVGFFEGAIGRQQMSVLGGDLLKRFDIIINAKRDTIYLRPNSLKELAFSDR